MLLHIARSQSVSQPASLFLEPEHFDTAARHPQFKSQQDLLRQLRARLFSDLSPPAIGVPKELAAAKASFNPESTATVSHHAPSPLAPG